MRLHLPFLHISGPCGHPHSCIYRPLSPWVWSLPSSWSMMSTPHLSVITVMLCPA